MAELNGPGSGLQLDGVLRQLGAFGRHQLGTLAMLALVYSTNSVYNINYVFAVEDVAYRCKIPASDNGSVAAAPWRDGDIVVKQCSYQAGSAELPCQEWEYEVSDSFAAELGLACQDWKLALVGTAHSAGNMLGQLLQGQLSDRYGRKRAAVVAGVAGGVLGLTKSYSTSFWGYVALEALEAAVGDALSPMFMLSIEVVEKRRAVLVQMILLNCYTGGLIIMPFIAKAFPYWRTFLRVIYAPALLIITYSFFLDESIRWLLSKGRHAEAVQLIQKIAKRNNVQLDKVTLNKLEYVDEDTKPEFSDSKALKETFKSRIMMQRFLVCMMWWLTVTLVNYGMMVSAVLIAGDKYVNFSLLMLMDVPANMLYGLALSKYKRKLPLFVSFLVGGILCISQPFVPKGYAWAGLALFMAFETLATFSSNIVYMYTSELFPTYTRNSMHAVCSALGRMGALLAPQTPLLMSVWAGLPQLIFGLSSVVCGGLTLLMPETANCELPDTVEQAEQIGRKARRPSPAPPQEPSSATSERLLCPNHESVVAKSLPP